MIIAQNVGIRLCGFSVINHGDGKINHGLNGSFALEITR